jgi:hypothetical protein
MNVASKLEKTAYYFPEHTGVIEGDQTIPYALFKRETV